MIGNASELSTRGRRGNVKHHRHYGNTSDSSPIVGVALQSELGEARLPTTVVERVQILGISILRRSRDV